MFVVSIFISKIISLTDANFKTLTLYLSKKFKILLEQKSVIVNFVCV